MRVKMILPALTEAKSPFFRPVKYSLFPPLGLATLAAYLDDADEITLVDEHVQRVPLDDDPELVVIQSYISSAFRAYELADYYRERGAHVCIGGVHATSLPCEAAQHADTVFLGPGEDTWPEFLRGFRAAKPRGVYQSQERNLPGQPRARRDLINRDLYVMPNSIVATRGCPHACDFCYKTDFFKGGKSFYTRAVDDVLTEIESLPGHHLYFLDDNLFADPRFARALLDGLRGMGRVWQAAGTVKSALAPGLMEPAAEAGLQGLFVGFETLNEQSLREQGKYHNRRADYDRAIARLHELGIMVNGSFVFGMDHDYESVFDRTVEWSVEQGMETATYHVLTPYPGTPLYSRLWAQERIKHTNWDLYDTRHAVFTPAQMSAETLESGYWRAYRRFYSWSRIFEGAWSKQRMRDRLRHLLIAGAWKKCEPIWDLIIRARRASVTLPLLEKVLGAGQGDGQRSGKLVTSPALQNAAPANRPEQRSSHPGARG